MLTGADWNPHADMGNHVLRHNSQRMKYDGDHKEYTVCARRRGLHAIFNLSTALLVCRRGNERSHANVLGRTHREQIKVFW